MLVRTGPNAIAVERGVFHLPLKWSILLTCIGAAIVSLLPGLLGQSQAAKIKQKTEVRDYRVYGTTPGLLVSYMKRRPFRGDNGPAMANIRPKYKLKTTTQKTSQKSGFQCKVKRIELNIRFVMTLPRSMDAKKQNRKTKNAWRSFRAFARRHEEQHRRIYLACARDFVRKATRIAPQRSCRQITWQVKNMLKTHEKDCDRKHLAFDRREFPRVPSLSLFRHARLEKVQKIRSHRKTASRTRPTWFSRQR